MDIFSILFNMKVCCVFSLESPHRGDSNEHTQYTIFNINKKIILRYPKSAAIYTIYHFQYKQENHPKISQICSYEFLFQGTQE